MCRELLSLQLPFDIVFLDDASPDGTGEVLDRLSEQLPQVSVIHRTGKFGIGSAHLHGIYHAYDHGYQRLITMDCDFTHSPSDLPRLVELADRNDVAVGSRYLERNSLPGWNPYRRFLTMLGHGLTTRLLRMPYDATGAFRVYNLDQIPREVFGLIASRGYSFFFESLFLLFRNGCSIGELAIRLPARTYGHSKMSFREAARSAKQVFTLYLATITNPGQFHYVKQPVRINPTLVDPQGWDNYWNKKNRAANVAYELVAAIYRRNIIKRQLNRFVFKHFKHGSELLHAGCGSGQVDEDIQHRMRIFAVDISGPALELYQRNNPKAIEVKHESIFNLPWPADRFDGVYNLGVMEHFTSNEIARILAELGRILKPGGKIVIFWPHKRASSVIFLNFVHWVFNRVLKRELQLHPAEISLLESRKQAERIIKQNHFEMVDFYFGMRDGFVQAVIVAKK